MTMLACMILAEPEPLLWLRDGTPYQYDIHHAPWHAILADYSDELKDLVQACVVFKHEDRLSFEETLTQIEDAIVGQELDHVRMDAKRDAPQKRNRDTLMTRKDNYKTALAVRDLGDPAPRHNTNWYPQ